MESVAAEKTQQTPERVPMEPQVTEPSKVYDVEAPAAAGNKGYLFLKRSFDIVLSLVLGIVLMLPMLLIAALIRIDSPGPALFRQERLGKDGKPFVIYKFRTMRMDAPSELSTWEFTDSSRYITKVGGFLRRTSIDELPQLWNILRGEMSFVGYRPVCLTETELNKLRQEYGVFSVKPGLTGLAQVCGRDNIDFREKAGIDAEYVKKRGIKLDAWCLFKTVAVVFNGEGTK